MTQQTRWYRVVVRAAPVNVPCHVIRPALAADSALRKEVTLVSMSVTGLFSTSSTIYRCGSRTEPLIDSWVTGPCPASFNHKPDSRTAFSVLRIAPVPVWANVLISHRQAWAFLITRRLQTIRERTLVRQEAFSAILARQTVQTSPRRPAALP